MKRTLLRTALRLTALAVFAGLALFALLPAHALPVGHAWKGLRAVGSVNANHVLVNAKLAQALPKVEVLRYIPNDDSVVVVFRPVPGAVDYGVYVVGDETHIKAHGQEAAIPPPVGGTILWEKDLFDFGDERSIELNSVNKKCRVIVRAYDGLLPYQPMVSMDPGMSMPVANVQPHAMDGALMPEDKQAADSSIHITNGHGSGPMPNVIAQSDPFTIQNKRRGVRTLTGTQRFYESWRDFPGFVKTGNNPHLPNSQFQATGEYEEYETPRQKNGKVEWRLSFWGGAVGGCYPLMMKDHAMWRLEDGGGHVTNASALLELTGRDFDISKGKCLHVTWEWNPFATSRNWHDLLIIPKGDRVTNPGKLDTPPFNWPTLSGDAFRLEVQFNAFFGQVFHKGVPTEVVNIGWGPDGKNWREVARVFWDGWTPMANGTMLDVDKRHRFDLYLWKTGCQVEERDALGRLLNRAHREFAEGVAVSFEKCQIAFDHELYHTALRAQELAPRGAQMVLYRDHLAVLDQIHSDNVAVEVLPGPPVLGSETVQ